MTKQRIVIVDEDFFYIIPLQAKFIYKFGDSVEIEVITQKNYLINSFNKIQKVDILIISENMYFDSLLKHEIKKIFVLTEEKNEKIKSNNVQFIYKYKSLNEIILDIVGNDFNNLIHKEENNSQIILVTSANGGVGKTTMAIGLSMGLSDMYKKVLYIQASYLQTFQQYIDNDEPIKSNVIYQLIDKSKKNIYEKIKYEIRNQNMYYLPPFRTSLMSLGMEYSIFEMIAKQAKEAGDFDYIIIDSDIVLDKNKASMMNLADKVIIISEATETSVYATNRLIDNIENYTSEKYLFICNFFDDDKQKNLNAAEYRIDEYIKYNMSTNEKIYNELDVQESLRKIAFLLI
ncbi:AAA family ATPase [Eubacterium sp.]